MLTSTDLHNALRSFEKNPLPPLALRSTRLFQLERATEKSDWRAMRTLLKRLIEEVTAQDHKHGQLLAERFVIGLSVKEAANTYIVSEQTIYNWQREGLAQVTRIANRRESEAQSTLNDILEERLPTPGAELLVGIDEQVASLVEALAARRDKGIFAIEGLGGLGKSSLADRVTRYALGAGMFIDCAWASVQRNPLTLPGERSLVTPLTLDSLVDEVGLQLLPDLFQASNVTRYQKESALRSRLKEMPHLVVIDNVEEIQTGVLTALLELVQKWAYPSKFVLVSRNKLAAELHYPMWHHAVPPLSATHSLHLIRLLAERQNTLSEIGAASNERLMPIYETVGGNPLALRLVVGQSAISGLDAVLQDLHTARGKRVEELYKHIYFSAWRSLPENSRQLLLLMPLIDQQSGSEETLVRNSFLTKEEVREALAELVERNLVDKRGSFDPRYSVHNLTRTFLEEQIAVWEV